MSHSGRTHFDQMTFDLFERGIENGHPGHTMRDKSFELETKLVLLNFFEHTGHGRSHSCDLTTQYGLVPSDVASRRYRSLPESSRERSPANHNSSHPDFQDVELNRPELPPEILQTHFSRNSSELSSGSFDSSNTDADDELESNPSIGSNFSHNLTYTRRTRLSTVYSESELALSPDITSGRIPPPNCFPQVFKDSTDDSSDLQVDCLVDEDDSSSSSSSVSTNPDDTFRDEVRHMKENLQSENEELKSLGNTPDSEGQSRPLSPISDAARKLGKISDEIQRTYGPRIDQSLCNLCLEHLSYDEFCNILNSLLGPAEASWIMISAVMLFSRRCARYFFNQGVDCMRQIVDFTTNYLGDVAADFIINNGGWTTVTQFSEDQLLDAQLQNFEPSLSDNNCWQTREPLSNNTDITDNTNLSYGERHSHISTPLEYPNPEPSEEVPSPNNLDPTFVVAFAALMCVSLMYLTN